MSVAMLAAAVLPAFITWTVIALLLRTPWAPRLADHPNERSLHARPTPRLGGIGLMAAVLPFAFLHASGALAAIVSCACALSIVSLADDASSLPVEVRLPAHLTASLVVVLAIAEPPAVAVPWGWAGAALAVVGLAWMANLYNFMDGSDGLAGGMGAFGFATLAAGAAYSGEAALAAFCAALASACAGFLGHNFPPARAFLGDSGSIPLGFFAGAIGLQGSLAGAWSPWFPLLAFSPFIVDATLTLLRRLARGERVWIAHRDHAYQRLVLAGWSRRRLALSAYALMAAAGASALVLARAEPMLQCGIIFSWAAAYALLAMAIEWKKNKKTVTARD